MRWRSIKKIFLVRHGQTDSNLNRIVQGQHDTPLNDTGRKQARKAAEKLKNSGAELVVSSDLKRARETAEIIASMLGIPLKTDKRLREMNLGIWEGKTFEEVARDESAKIWSEKPSQWKIRGSETLFEVQKRMIEAINELSDVKKAIIVSHGIAIATLLLYFKDLSLDLLWKYLPENASVNEIELESANESVE